MKAVVLVVAMLFASFAHAGTISLAWDPVTHVDLVGYRVYYGGAPSVYNQAYDTDLTPSITLLVNDCQDYYIAVKARGTDDTVSAEYSAELSGWARPKVLTASPAEVEMNTQGDMTITGANFQPGATVQVSSPDVTINSVTVVDCNTLIANMDIAPGTPHVTVDVEVINPDQVFGAGASLFEILPPGLMPPGQTDRDDKK
jgi:hypothetical protein